MSAHEIEAAIIRLTPQQLLGVITWLQEYHTETDDLPAVDEPVAEQLDVEQPEVEAAYEDSR